MSENENVPVVQPVQSKERPIAKIAEALSKAQGQMTPASEDGKVDHGGGKMKYSYATLASVWDAIRKPLSQNGLAVTQTICKNTLFTTLMHTSGEFIRGEMPIIAPPNCNPQQYGSALTYARRYALMAIVGAAPGEEDGDDDGGAASGKDEKQKPPQQKNSKQKPHPPETRDLSNPPPDETTQPGAKPRKCSKEERDHLYYMADKAGLDKKHMRTVFLPQFKVSRSHDLSAVDIQNAYIKLEQIIEVNARKSEDESNEY